MAMLGIDRVHFSGPVHELVLGHLRLRYDYGFNKRRYTPISSIWRACLQATDKVLAEEKGNKVQNTKPATIAAPVKDRIPATQQKAPGYY